MDNHAGVGFVDAFAAERHIWHALPGVVDYEARIHQEVGDAREFVVEIGAPVVGQVKIAEDMALLDRRARPLSLEEPELLVVPSLKDITARNDRFAGPSIAEKLL